MKRSHIIRGFLRALALLIIMLPISGFAGITFEKTCPRLEDDEGHSVDRTSDGGYIVTGYSKPQFGDNSEMLLLKTGEMSLVSAYTRISRIPFTGLP